MTVGLEALEEDFQSGAQVISPPPESPETSSRARTVRTSIWKRWFASPPRMALAAAALLVVMVSVPWLWPERQSRPVIEFLFDDAQHRGTAQALSTQYGLDTGAAQLIIEVPYPPDEARYECTATLYSHAGDELAVLYHSDDHIDIRQDQGRQLLDLALQWDTQPRASKIVITLTSFYRALESSPVRWSQTYEILPSAVP